MLNTSVERRWWVYVHPGLVQLNSAFLYFSLNQCGCPTRARGWMDGCVQAPGGQEGGESMRAGGQAGGQACVVLWLPGSFVLYKDRENVRGVGGV